LGEGGGELRQCEDCVLVRVRLCQQLLRGKYSVLGGGIQLVLQVCELGLGKPAQQFQQGRVCLAFLPELLVEGQGSEIKLNLRFLNYMQSHN
jgi:hypothetical protein